MLEVFETAARYQMYHALALLAVAWIVSRAGEVTAGVSTAAGSGWAVLAGWLFVAGIVIFSGSLYAMVFTGVRGLGAVTPLGGVAFIAGWVCLAVAATKLS